ncbi:DNA translocase FtsK [hydrothermal vent metagenome]|uniref:DNA translocase FtsK n=1 Tax=hydrothermal vent metagenome TaxID=652676 RepID=A0A3B1BMU8_9ZZZZ
MRVSWRKILNEIVGVTLIACTVLLTISLASHTTSDPSFNSYLSNHTNVKNYAGIMGATLSDLVVQSVGAVAWLVPLGLFFIGVTLCSTVSGFTLFMFGTGSILLLASVSGILGIIFNSDPVFEGITAGGVAGQFIAHTLMVPWFSKYGSYVILTAFTLCSILVMTRLSIGEASLLLAKTTWRMKGFLAVAMAKIHEWTKLVPKIKFPLFMETVEDKRIKERKNRIKAKEEAEEIDDVAEPMSIPTIIDFTPIDQNSEDAPPIPAVKQKKGADAFQEEIFRFPKSGEEYQLPALKLLDSSPANITIRRSKNDLVKNSRILEKKLLDFGIEGRVTQVLPGPVITIFEFEPAPGVKVSRIVNLSDDLAMTLRASSLRILAPIPGKSVVGIEVPNTRREAVYLKEILSSNEYQTVNSNIPLALGRDVTGKPLVTDLAQVPHLLIAGATGSGKSVGINAMILSILYNASPADVKFIMIDPKMLELSIYDGIPHLIAPVVTNPKKAANALKWVVSEMEKRYATLSELGVRNISGYNRLVEENIEALRTRGIKPDEEEQEANEENPLTKKLPYIVVVIDELADLMMVSSKDVEDSLARLAQMARAAGIHLIVATQRPSVDVLTGLIKANFPARISFQVRSRVDSRTIIDSMGAEKLLGKGDMLFLPPGAAKMERIQGPFVSDSEIHRVVKYLKKQSEPEYNEEILAPQQDDDVTAETEEEMDEFYDQAVELVTRTRQASISMIQRRLRIGYNRAARIVETMERLGVVGPADGVKQREVYARALDDIETVN